MRKNLQHIITTLRNTLRTHGCALALLLVTLCLGACTADEYLGMDKPSAPGPVISLNGGAGATTRAALNGKDAADLLGGNFVVYGFKTKSDDTQQTVYDHYNVKYTDGSAYTTTSNTAGWEYVNQDANVLNTNLYGSSERQDIKYWDFEASQYDFVAFSAGTATQVNTTPTAAGEVQFSAVDKGNLTTKAYTITGATEDIAKVFIADRYTAKPSASASAITNRQGTYRDAIQFNFRNVAAQVRIGFYETIPGYSVKDVKFYYSDAEQSTATLTAGTPCLPNRDMTTMTVAFPQEDASAALEYNRAHVVGYTQVDDKAPTDKVTLSTLDANTLVTREHLEDNTGNKLYLGRASTNATMTTGYTPMLPNESGTPLTLKVDYTLVSLDGPSGIVPVPVEEITVHGATAVVPASYAQWRSNYVYTYIFKISDNTNGLTNPNKHDLAGLYPIVFDAVVSQTDEGNQETVTTLGKLSITSYSPGEQVSLENKEGIYVKDNRIYVCCQSGNVMETLTNENCRLLQVTVDAGTLYTFVEYKRIKKLSDSYREEDFNDLCSGDESMRPYKPISEVVVKDLVANYTPDGNVYTSGENPTNHKMTATVLATPTIVNQIPVADAPYGQAVPGSFAVFTPTSAGYYAFEFTEPERPYTDLGEYNEDHPDDLKDDDWWNENKSTEMRPIQRHYKIIQVRDDL